MPLPVDDCRSVRDLELQKFTEDKNGDAAVNTVINNDTLNPIPVTSDPSTSITIANQTATTAGVEYSYTIPDNTKQMLIRTRGNASLQISFASGQSGSVFITIPGACSWSIDGLSFSGKTIYYQANKNGAIIEIATWQ